MEIPKAAASARFFEQSPSFAHSAGDIWKGLPTFGLFESTNHPAIVITPSCDLAQSKSITITYLPILTLREAFEANLLLSVVRSEFNSRVQAHLTKTKLRNLPKRTIQSDSLLKGIEDEANNALQSATKQKAKTQIIQLLNICRYFRFLESPSIMQCPTISEVLTDSTVDRITQLLVRNSFSTDFHFLPSDGNSGEEWETLSKPSLVYFRSPMTVPAYILDEAARSSDTQWDAFINKQSSWSDRLKKLPIKTLTVKSPFYEELLARYVSLYVKMGTPDFTAEAVSDLAKEMK